MIPPPAPKPAREPRAPISLEQFLGAKAFAAAGSLIVVVGVVLFLKFAYDQGWIGQIPPAVRCLIGAAFGLALIGVGETVRKKIGAFASSGLTATGLASLYATVLVARHVFELIGPAGSFFLLVAVTLTGIVLSTRGRRLFTAYISLAGAYAVPFIIGATDPAPAVLPMYLVALLVFGLALAAGMGGVFRSLRPTVWGATALIGGFWIVAMGTENLWTALAFLSVVWCVVHLELCITVLARRSTWKPAVLSRMREEDFLRWLTGIPEPSVSLSATVWSAIGAIIVVRGVDASWQAVPVFVLAAACSLLVWRLSPTMDVLRGVVISARTAMGISLCLQAAGLVVAGVALQFSGNDQDLAWLVLGAVACVIGRRLDAKPLVVYGLITLGILLARLLLQWAGLHSDGGSAFAVSSTQWTVKAVFAALAVLIAALCCERFGRGFVLSLTGLAVALLLATPLVPDAGAGSVAMVWTGVAVLALIGSGGKRWLELDSMAVAVATLATIPVLAAFAEYMPDGDGRLVFVLACGLAIAVQIGMADLVRRELIAPILKRLYPATVACAVVLLSIAPLTPETSASTTTVIWSALAGLLVTVAWRGRWLSFDVFAGAVGTAAVLAWIAHLIVDFRISETLVWNPTMASGVVAAAALCLSSFSLYRSRRSGAPPGELRRVFGHSLCTLGVLTLLASTSIEAIRAGDALFPSEAARAACLSVWWAAFGLMALGAAKLRRLDRVRVASLSLIEFAGVMALVSPLPWLVHLIVEYRVDAFFALNLTFGSGVAATTGLWFAAYALRHQPAAGEPRDSQRLVFGNALGATGAMVLLIATSIEAVRAGQSYIEDETARQAVLSIWWATFGVIGLVFGSIQKMKSVRLACLVLIGFAALKVVIYDLANVSPIWRIASSLALGMLMLLIGVAYAKSLTTSQKRGAE